MYHPRLQGTHYDMGFHYGELLHKNSVSFDGIIRLTEDQMDFGKASLKICQKYVPEICAEIKGLADGLNFSFETFASWLLTMYNYGDEYGCTCFCFINKNRTVFARNSDMFPDLKQTSESIVYRPKDGYRFLGHSTAMISMEDGINEHGLAVGMNFLATKVKRPGLNTGFLVRNILEHCRNVEEAIAVLRNVPISSTQNIMLADPSNHIAVVECSPQQIVVRTPKNNGMFLVSANHFIADTMQNEHANPVDNWFSSHERYNTACEALQKEIPPDGVDYAKDILSGHHGFMCQYPKDLNFQTIWSVVYDLTDMKIYCAEGNPSKTKFQEDTRLAWCMSKK